MKPIPAGLSHIGVMEVVRLRLEGIHGSVDGIVVKCIRFQHHQFNVLNGQSFFGHIAAECSQHYRGSYALGDGIFPVFLLVVVYFECIGVVPRYICGYYRIVSISPQLLDLRGDGIQVAQGKV